MRSRLMWYVCVLQAWTRRQQGFGKTLGRMYSVSPAQGEIYYLRLLLCSIPGAVSFEDLRTVRGTCHDSFKAACIAANLLTDDRQIYAAMEEAVDRDMPQALRTLFAVFMGCSPPKDPCDLFNRFEESLCEDFLRADQRVRHSTTHTSRKLARLTFIIL